MLGEPRGRKMAETPSPAHGPHEGEPVRSPQIPSQTHTVHASAPPSDSSWLKVAVGFTLAVCVQVALVVGLAEYIESRRHPSPSEEPATAKYAELAESVHQVQRELKEIHAQLERAKTSPNEPALSPVAPSAIPRAVPFTAAPTLPAERHDRLRIAFWNLRDLSVRSRSEAERRQICQVILQQKFTMVAVCEVNDSEILGDLAAILSQAGDRWKSVTSQKVGNSPPASEYYGVLFDDDILEFRDAWQLPKKKLRDLGIGDLDVPADLEFNRNPYAVLLGTDDGRFHFAIVIVHVTYGTTVNPRIAEIRALATYYKEVFPREHDVLLGGDFNRNVTDDKSLGWLKNEAKLIDTTSVDPPTVIQGTNTYDHILLNTTYTKEYENVHGVVDFDRTMFGGNTPAAKKAVSDHRPVWIDITVPGP
jgi:endonuclease/exonuclease/phosphatase family metal-dependent hydrolase